MAAAIEQLGDNTDRAREAKDWHEHHEVPRRVRCNADDVVVDLFHSMNGQREKVTLKSGVALTLLAPLMEEFVLSDDNTGISYLLRSSTLKKLLASGDLVSLDPKAENEAKGADGKDGSVDRLIGWFHRLLAS
ncbi:MAG: hypothetical protein WC873_00490 [Candidatus Gracilibacteria bacterium]